MAEKSEVEQLRAEVAELKDALAKVLASQGQGTSAAVVTPAHLVGRNRTHEQVRAQIADTRTKKVKIRVARFVKAKGPEGSLAQVATPIVLGPGWNKLWPGERPPVFEPGKEYEVPEPVAKALGPDVQLV